MKPKVRPVHIYYLMAISMLLSIFIAKFPTIINISSLALYFSAIAGYAGLMLLLWNFILGTRSVVGLFSRDYAEIIKMHSLIGKYGTLLIFAHPLLVIASYGQSLLFTIWPEFSSQFESAITYGRVSLWIILVIWISSALLKQKMSFRPWKYLHLGAYISAPFALLHVPDSGSSYASLLSARIYFWAIVVGFAIFGLLRLRGALNLNKSKYVIVGQEQVCPNVFTLTIRPTDADFVQPKNGQYIYIKTGWFSEDHPFSVMSFDPTTNIIQIGYKVFGDFTKKLSKIPAGRQLFISGPFGNFTNGISNLPCVFIAGGIGVTPFISRILNENNSREQWLFYSNKEKSTAAYLGPIKQALAGRLIQIYKNDDGDEAGYITAMMIQKYIHQPEKYNYYICGSEKLTKSVTNELQKCGVAKNNVKSESFNF